MEIEGEEGKDINFTIERDGPCAKFLLEYVKGFFVLHISHKVHNK